MSFVWKHPRSGYWTAGYRDESGKWRRVPTKQKLRAKAIHFAQDLEDLGAQIREHRLSELAFLKECDRMRRRRFGDHNLLSVREYLRTWLRGGSSKAEGTATRYAGSVKHFLDFLGPRAEQPLANLEPAECHAYHNHLIEQQLAPATRVVEIKTLRTIFNAARKDRLLTFNPAESVTLPRHIRQVTRKTFTPEEVEILLREAGENSEWYTLILFGIYTAMRLGDAKSRSWKDVSFTAHKLTYRAHKTGEELQIPLHARLEEHLTAIAGDSLGPICPKLAIEPVGGRNGLSQKFIALMRRAGLSTESVATGGQRQLATRSFHSLRKSFNTWLRDGGVTQEDRKQLTGHKSDAVNDRYTEVKMERLRVAVKRLPKLERLGGKQMDLALGLAPDKK